MTRPLTYIARPEAHSGTTLEDTHRPNTATHTPALLISRRALANCRLNVFVLLRLSLLHTAWGMVCSTQHGFRPLSAMGKAPRTYHPASAHALGNARCGVSPESKQVVSPPAPARVK
jgi:hypothetical protein